MTEKELHKLRRQDLLELLLSQSREVVRLREELQEREGSLAQSNDTVERLKNRLNEKDESLGRLKTRLDEKDATIEKLKGRLDAKDATIAELRQECAMHPAAEGESGYDPDPQLQALLNEREAEIQRLQAQIRRRDEELEELRSDLSVADAEGGLDLDQVIADFKLTNDRLKDKLDAKDLKIEKLYERLYEKDDMLGEIRAELKSWRGARQQELEETLSGLRQSNARLRKDLEDRDAQLLELRSAPERHT